MFDANNVSPVINQKTFPPVWISPHLINPRKKPRENLDEELPEPPAMKPRKDKLRGLMILNSYILNFSSNQF